ncbi:MAG: hypothetical protein EAZ85_01865 [Bacteroidetes bacterium]|nr:MAG: hypothetical protein EAZ85_01865 [Bacteroidota bacterium]TAG90386.1 MAG: hypothetical protein EAZ20_04465 [Bacteroidota bacterium]
MFSKKYFIQFLLFFIYLFLIFSATAQETRPKRQPSATRNIQDLYHYIKEKVKKNQYYENSIVLNQNKFEWNDAQKKQIKQSSHYSYMGDTPTLRMCKVVEIKNKISYETEYLYDNDGKIILIFETQNDYEAVNYRELKFFFEKEKCINIMVNKEILPADNQEYSSKMKKMQEEATRLKQYFLTEMNEYQNE